MIRSSLIAMAILATATLILVAATEVSLDGPFVLRALLILPESIRIHPYC
jgi:hypothetical protein